MDKSCRSCQIHSGSNFTGVTGNRKDLGSLNSTGEGCPSLNSNGKGCPSLKARRSSVFLLRVTCQTPFASPVTNGSQNIIDESWIRFQYFVDRTFSASTGFMQLAP